MEPPNGGAFLLPTDERRGFPKCRFSMDTPFPTGTLTLVFTDLEGSSELSEKHGAAFEAARMAHFGLLREAASRFHGYEVETAGDALFLVFQNAVDAVQFAVESQIAMSNHAWPTQFSELRVRIGLHTGEPFIGEDKGRPTFRGPVTNKAARVQAAGHGGQSLVSQATRDAVQRALPSEVSFLDCGVHRLKGVGEEHLWQIAHSALHREFPPLNTLNPQRHNLPQPALPLIGRENEIAAWHESLLNEHTRLLTLTGFGGLGKTRSALQLAELCVGDFSEGVWWIELEETRSSEAMLARIAMTLRMQPQPNLPLKDQLWNYLRERQLLLVMDNTEQNPDAPQVISEVLRETTRVKCLVTTRRALGLRAEVLREVPPLPPADAARLFEGFAQTRREEFRIDDGNHADVREICARLEGVPLALELAASRISGLTPRDILRHLDQRFKVLQTRAPDLPPRQRALRGAIDWSFDLLSDDDKTLFAQLAVFRRGFTLDDAEAICETFDIFEGVQELRNQSLLRAETEAVTGATRFSMLESVREYAAEKLVEMPQLESVHQRHADYFLRFAEAQLLQLRTPEESRALVLFESHLDNVRAASRWAHEGNEQVMAMRLSLALGMFFQRSSLLNEAVNATEAGLHIAKPLAEEQPALLAQLWRERAGLHLDKGEPQKAVHCAEESLRLDEQTGNRKGLAEAHNLLALAQKRLKNFAQARLEFDKALQLFGEVHYEIGIAIVQTNLGAIECDDPMGDRNLGAKYLNMALELRRRQGDDRGLAEVLNNLGVLAQEDESWSDAEEFYREALSFEQRLQNAVGAARVLINLSEILEVYENWHMALRCALASAYLFEEAGSPLQQYALSSVERLFAHDGKNIEDIDLLRLHLQGKLLDEIVAWTQG